MPRDRFFEKTHCDRCHKTLDGILTMSWFNTQTICMNCADIESTIKRKMREEGINPDAYEGGLADVSSLIDKYKGYIIGKNQ